MSYEMLPSHPIDELRETILSRALGLYAVEGLGEEVHTLRRRDERSSADDGEVLVTRAFIEGTQADDAIVQLSFTGEAVVESHLTLCDDGRMTYEEYTRNDTLLPAGVVDTKLATTLLNRIERISPH